MISHARRRARNKGVPFNLTENDFEIPTECPILRIPLAVASGCKTHRDNSPTLDRIVPDLGYVRGNVQVLSALANQLKGDGTNEDIAVQGFG